jgi:hypothetical protein
MARHWLLDGTALAFATLMTTAAMMAQAPPAARSLAIADAQATPATQLRLRLVGLLAAAPWSTEVTIEWTGFDASHRWRDRRHAKVQKQPDATGVIAIDVPDWPPAVSRTLRVRTADPLYLDVDLPPVADPDLAIEHSIAVRPAGRWTSRVVDAAGNAQVAGVLAYRPYEGAAMQRPVAATRTAADGTFVLKVPPEEPLWIIATPVPPSFLGPRSRCGTCELARRLRHGIQTLPTCVQATGHLGAAQALPPMVQAQAAIVSGRILRNDEIDVHAPIVTIAPTRGTPLEVMPGLVLHRQSDGKLLLETSVGADLDGNFALPAHPGSEVDVRIGDAQVQAQPVVRRILAPDQLRFELPASVLLQAMRRGAPDKAVDIEIEGRGTIPFSAGFLLVLPNGSMRVRAVDGLLRGPWRTIGAADAGTILDLELR